MVGRPRWLLHHGAANNKPFSESTCCHPPFGWCCTVLTHSTDLSRSHNNMESIIDRGMTWTRLFQGPRTFIMPCRRNKSITTSMDRCCQARRGRAALRRRWSYLFLVGPHNEMNSTISRITLSMMSTHFWPPLAAWWPQRHNAALSSSS